MALSDKEERIVAARMKLRERYLAKHDPNDRPLGSGPPNAHGMPRLPPGQYESKKWPVLDLGRQPEVQRAEWKLIVDGQVEQPLAITWEDLGALPQHEQRADFHCVTGWSRFDLRMQGVQLGAVLALAHPRPEARHLLCHGYDGYSTNISLEEAIKDDVLLLHTVDGAPLAQEHGGPVRVVTPQLWAWKGAKWVSRLEVRAHDKPGYWEERGYSNTAHPWRDDRYG